VSESVLEILCDKIAYIEKMIRLQRIQNAMGPHCREVLNQHCGLPSKNVALEHVMAGDQKNEITKLDTVSDPEKAQTNSSSGKPCSADFELTDNFCKKRLSKADLKKQ